MQGKFPSHNVREYSPLFNLRNVYHLVKPKDGDTL